MERQNNTMNKVKIAEIGPRDGFQSVKPFIPTPLKLEIIDGLIASGLKKIQVTSFVSPKAIPQMQDAAEVTQAAMAKHPDIEFFALVPNFRGAENAVNAGLTEVSPVISLSAAHNKANVNRTHEESLEEIQKIITTFPQLKISQDIATVFGCPYEGKQEIAPLLRLMDRLYAMGIRSFTLCDTIGVAYPKQVELVLAAVRKHFPDCQINIHIHDTRNMGILNTYAAIEAGIDEVQTAVGGLGGCPFAPGASGNTSTEDLVYLLHKEGYDTGVCFDTLLATAKKAYHEIDGNFSGHHIKIEADQCGFTK